MKKLQISFLVFILLFSTCFTSLAEDTHNAPMQIEYLADGSYYITELTTNDISTYFSAKTAKKNVSYYSSSNVLLWTFTVIGTFTYNGTISSCNSATDSLSIYNSNWSVVSKSSYPSANKAVGNIVMHQAGGANTSRTITLTCYPDGTLK